MEMKERRQDYRNLTQLFQDVGYIRGKVEMIAENQNQTHIILAEHVAKDEARFTPLEDARKLRRSSIKAYIFGTIGLCAGIGIACVAYADGVKGVVKVGWSVIKLTMGG